MFSRRDILSLIVVVILLVGIPIAITLLREQQILKSRAAITPIKFSAKNTKLISDAAGSQKLIAVKRDVELELTSTLETLATAPPKATAQPTSNPTSAPTSPPYSQSSYTTYSQSSYSTYSQSSYTQPPVNRSPSVSIWEGNAGAKSTIFDSESLTINFNRNGDVNAVNLVIDGAEEGVPTQVIVPLSGGATQITWPASHARHTIGSHSVGIKGYYCPNVGSNDPCTAASGVDTRTINVIANPPAGRAGPSSGAVNPVSFSRGSNVTFNATSSNADSIIVQIIRDDGNARELGTISSSQFGTNVSFQIPSDYPTGTAYIRFYANKSGMDQEQPSTQITVSVN